MTKKDYIAIAQAIKQTDEWHDMAGGPVLPVLIGKLVYIMERDNPRFDRARFLQACGVQS